MYEAKSQRQQLWFSEVCVHRRILRLLGFRVHVSVYVYLYIYIHIMSPCPPSDRFKDTRDPPLSLPEPIQQHLLEQYCIMSISTLAYHVFGRRRPIK